MTKRAWHEGCDDKRRHGDSNGISTWAKHTQAEAGVLRTERGGRNFENKRRGGVGTNGYSCRPYTPQRKTGKDQRPNLLKGQG